MSTVIVIGAQWGDEGKGKTVDLLAGKMDLVVRYQGGANAGHTVVIDDSTHILHLLPAGVLSPRCINIIGNGCVVDPQGIISEIDGLEKRGVSVPPDRLTVSGQAHVVTPVHRFMDHVFHRHIGTTGRGIGPCYTDKVQRTGIRVETLIGDLFEKSYRKHHEYYKSVSNQFDTDQFPDLETSLTELSTAARRLEPYVGDTAHLLQSALERDDNILYEGAQGTLLDVDHGTYPFVTSSNTTIGSAYTGGGVYISFDNRIGVVKAYSTRVGEGPFPTEQQNVIGATLRERGGEFGATTGRPRRCGWIDLVLLRRAKILNGFNYIVLTKLDCLSGLEHVLAAVDYDNDGEPVYKKLEGWEEDITGMTSFDELPQSCRGYVEFVEESLGVPVGMLSTGPPRAHTIWRREL
jgi:adenylosuccinate synthase